MQKLAFPGLEPERSPLESRETYQGSHLLLSECEMLGWSRFERASSTLGPHSHAGSYEICYIVSGTVEWWVGSQIFQIGPRDLFLTRPGEEHGGVDAFMHPCELYWVQVRPRSSHLRALSRLTHRHFRGGPILANYFERLLAEHRSAQNCTTDDHSRIAARASLRLLITDVVRFHQLAEQDPDRPAVPSAAIAAAMDSIHQGFTDNDCLEWAARAAGLRDTQFRKRFQAETGFAPHEYLVRAQVQEAKRRLAKTDQPVTKIAFDLGFSSSQYFATVFRKLTGLTPQGYRQQRAVATKSPSRS